MSSVIDIFEPFTRIQPGTFISKYSDWILFTLLLFFFLSVVGIALKKKFEDSRYLRVLVASVALMLSIGTYYSIYRGWLHLSLEGLGFFGAVLLLIIVFFVIFGLMRGYGMSMSTALPLGYALFYLSLWAVSPNILHTIADTIPLINLILLILFIASVVKSVSRFFHHSRSPLADAKELQNAHFATTDDVEIDREIAEDKKEGKLLKNRTMKLTKLEIDTLDDIEDYLEQILRIIREKGNTIHQVEVAELTQALRQIAHKQNVLKKGMELIRKHVYDFETTHRKDISEIEKRLAETTDKKNRKLIQEELAYQKHMLEAMDFMQKYEPKVLDFCQSFNKLLAAAMQKLKNHYPNDALSYLEYAHSELQEMKNAYDKQKALEKYVLKLNKKTISDLKKEKNPK
jgi:hypothetical protein